MTEYDKLKKSLQHLEQQYANYLSMNERDNLTNLDKDAISESVVRRFKPCYDTSWKHLKKYLEEEVGLVAPNSPKPIFRLAYENSIIEEVENWFEYAQARIDTAHDYNEEKFMDTLEKAGDFIWDAIELYKVMTKESW
ncbi:MAG: nucleotidyltransferase [Candidatus Scalindua sp.]|nr:nucleotidyltransferase [Candidatus Scalindua sp.]